MKKIADQNEPGYLDQELPLEELTTHGSGSGLEAEQDENDIDIQTPFDPKLIDVITQQRTIDLLLTRLKHKELNLTPDFQRRANLWSTSQKSSLIESILLRIPIPSLYISEDEQGNYQVVDGLQRLCAIAHFVNCSDLNKALGTTSKLAPLRLSNLPSLKDLDDQSFDDLPRDLQRRINETELTLHIIRAGTPSNVKFNIFSRINQGGLPLKSQEIRNAVFKGKWQESVRRMASSEDFLNATERKVKGERLEDHELVLRFAANYSLRTKFERPTEQNLDEFLNDFVEKKSFGWGESEWREIEHAFQKAMKAAPSVFGKLSFRKFSEPNQPRRPINRGLFEAESVVLASHSEKDIATLANHSNDVLELFGKKLKEEKSFYNSLLYATGKGAASNTRIRVMSEIFKEVLQNA